MHLSMVERRREGPAREENCMCTVPPDEFKDQQHQWLVSAMIEWIISQSLLTREGADSIQAERQQHPAVRCPPFTDR